MKPDGTQQKASIYLPVDEAIDQAKRDLAANWSRYRRNYEAWR